MGFKTTFHGLGDPVGAGTNFQVWRHKITIEVERVIFQICEGQDRQLAPLGTVLALKRIIPRVNSQNEIELENEKQLSALALEVQSLTNLSLRRHENIVKLWGLVWEDRLDEDAAWPTLVLEYCEMTLAEALTNPTETLRTDHKISIGKGIGQGLFALHLQNIVHGDIKTENVLLKIEGAGRFTPKLADFGCALLNPDNTKEIDTEKTIWVGGTNPWRAPEVGRGSPFLLSYSNTSWQYIRNDGHVLKTEAYATDLYSYGMLWWRMFHDNQDPLNLVLQRDHKIVTSTMKEQLKAESSLGAIAEEDVLSYIPEHTENVIISRLVKHLLQVIPIVRVQRLVDLLTNYHFIEAEETYRQYKRLVFEESKLPTQSTSPSEKQESWIRLETMDKNLHVCHGGLAFIDCVRLR